MEKFKQNDQDKAFLAEARSKKYEGGGKGATDCSNVVVDKETGHIKGIMDPTYTGKNAPPGEMWCTPDIFEDFRDKDLLGKGARGGLTPYSQEGAATGGPSAQSEAPHPLSFLEKLAFEAIKNIAGRGIVAEDVQDGPAYANGGAKVQRGGHGHGA